MAAFTNRKCDHQLRSQRLTYNGARTELRTFCLYCGQEIGGGGTWQDQDEVGKALAAQRQAEQDKRDRAETDRRERMKNTTKRRFHNTKGTSNKFWEVWRVGNMHVVQYGRIGTDGQKRTKDHGSVAAANEAIRKLILQKLGKGYLEVDGDDFDEVTYEETFRRNPEPNRASTARSRPARKKPKPKPKAAEPPGFLQPRRAPKVKKVQP